MRKRFSFIDCENAVEQAIIDCEKSVKVKEYEEWRKKQPIPVNVPSVMMLVNRYGSFIEAKNETIRLRKTAAVIVRQAEKERLKNKKRNFKESIHRPRITKERCIASMHEAAKVYGITLSKKNYQKWREEQPEKINHPTADTINTIFFGWKEAKEAADLQMSEYYRKIYSKQECKQALNRASQDLGVAFSIEAYTNWRKKNKGYPCLKSIEKEYGTWNKGMKAAGLQNGIIREEFINYDSEDLPYYTKTLALIDKHQKISAKIIRDELNIGSKRVTRLLKRLEENKVIGPVVRGRPAKIL